MPTIGDLSQEHGYASILIGKTHFQPLASVSGSPSIECQPVMRDLDFGRGFHGPWYGFDHGETGRMHGHESRAGKHLAIWMEEKGLHSCPDSSRSRYSASRHVCPVSPERESFDQIWP